MATDPEGEKESLYIKTKYLTPSQGERGRERKREREEIMVAQVQKNHVIS